MARDFTLSKYRQLLEAIQENGYRVLPVGRFLKEKISSPCIILRHDVDRSEKRALDMAALEKDFGFQATYYFRVGRSLGRPGVIRAVSMLGHEVGYHYEVLSKAKGEPQKARQLFAKELGFLRQIAEVYTAAMHGRPLSPWNNMKFWESNSLKEFDLLGEAYLSFRDLTQFRYITDTGRCWNSENNLRDRFLSGGPSMPGPFDSTEDLIAILGKRLYPQIYLLAHPNRWTSKIGSWCLQWGEDVCANWLKKRLRASGV